MGTHNLHVSRLWGPKEGHFFALKRAMKKGTLVV